MQHSDGQRKLKLCMNFVDFLYPGAFLVPYLLCLLLAGMPVFLMEMSIGQMMQTNAVKAWKRICPLFGGKKFFTSRKTACSISDSTKKMR